MASNKSSQILPADAKTTAEATDEPKVEPSFIEKVEVVYDGAAGQAFVYALLFVALFGVDLFVVADVEDSANNGLYATLLVIMIVFAFEILFQCAVKDDYFENGWGFYFWTDFVGTVSMIVDIPWLVDLEAGAGEGVRTPPVPTDCPPCQPRRDGNPNPPQALPSVLVTPSVPAPPYSAAPRPVSR